MTPLVELEDDDGGGMRIGLVDSDGGDELGPVPCKLKAFMSASISFGVAIGTAGVVVVGGGGLEAEAPPPPPPRTAAA